MSKIGDMVYQINQLIDDYDGDFDKTYVNAVLTYDDLPKEVVYMFVVEQMRKRSIHQSKGRNIVN